MLEIKSLSTAELELAARVIRRGFESVAKEFKLTRENCPSNGAFLRTQRLIMDFMKGDLMYGLFDEGKMAGFIQLEKTSEDMVTLKRLTVLPEYRHHGYGSALLEFTSKRAAAWGGSRLELCIIEENIRLKKWYAQNGFIHIGTKCFDHLPFTVGTMVMILLPGQKSLDA